MQSNALEKSVINMPSINSLLKFYSHAVHYNLS